MKQENWIDISTSPIRSCRHEEFQIDRQEDMEECCNRIKLQRVDTIPMNPSDKKYDDIPKLFFNRIIFMNWGRYESIIPIDMNIPRNNREFIFFNFNLTGLDNLYFKLV